MAFIKEKQFENGSSGNYWKIIRVINLDFLNKEAEIMFGLFKDKKLNDDKFDKGTVIEAEQEKVLFTNEELIIGTKIVRFTKENFPFTKEALEGENIKAISYGATKQTNEFFQDAIDEI